MTTCQARCPAFVGARARWLCWCAFVLATMLQSAFGEPFNDPQHLQESGIAKIDHWLNYVRRTGDATTTISELEAARSELQASYELFLKRQDFAGASLSAIKTADIQRLTNQWQKAMPIYRDAIGLAQRANRTDYETKALAYLAFSELTLGDLDAARDHIREAIRLGENCGNKVFYFEALNVAGEIEVKRGNLVAAGEHIDRALAMSGQIDDKRQLYLAYLNRGDIYYQLALKSDYERNFGVYYQSLELARADFQTAVALSRELGDEFMSELFQSNLKDVDDRKAMIRMREEVDQTMANAKIEAFSPQKPADVLVTKHFTPGALDPALLAPIETIVKEFEDSRAGMQQRGLSVPELNHSDLFRRGNLAEMKGNNDAAIKAYYQAIELLEKDRRRLQDEQGRSAFLEDKMSYYYRPALLLLDREQYTEAFKLFERSRSRAMADLLANRPLTLGTAQERTLFADLQRLSAGIAAQQEKRFNLTGSQNRDNSAKAIVRLDSQIADLQRQYDQIQTRIAKETPKLKELTAAEPATLEKVQQSAAEGGYDILYYVVLDDALILWHINGDGVQVMNVFLPQAQLIKQATALHDSLVARKKAPDARFDEKISRQLFLFLIQPGLSSIKSNHLIIIPHEELNLIPFQALQDPATGKYLGESFAISYAPSATVLAMLENNSPLSIGALLLVADPSIHDAKEEVNAIGKLYPGRSRVVAQHLANKADVKTWVSDCNVIHLSVHGVFNAKDPLLSYLQFKEVPPDDGRLTAVEMFGLPLQKNSLVVLSACETGRVEATHANEILGMVRSLLYAGAGNLVLSSWEVDARSTRLWMETFYREGRTTPLAEAARRALIAVKSVPEYGHPFYWAPFVMTGK